MRKILVTGATGNIGKEVIRFLFRNNTDNEVIAGVRNIEKSKLLFADFPQLRFVEFDFENQDTFQTAFQDIDSVFLLRPPHISDVPRFFGPLIRTMKQKKVQEILFLSVQGAEKSSVIPHNKIEKLILDAGINYIFLRPGYFMQNLTTTLLNDIRKKQAIVLPAGKAKFNWIDTENIGETAALLLLHANKHINSAIELTGYENENFETVCKTLSKVIGHEISFADVNPFKFFRIKKKEQMNTGMIVVMIMLHFLPRFQKNPNISRFYEELTGKKPTKLEDFIKRERQTFLN